MLIYKHGMLTGQRSLANFDELMDSTFSQFAPNDRTMPVRLSSVARVEQVNALVETCLTVRRELVRFVRKSRSSNKIKMTADAVTMLDRWREEVQRLPLKKFQAQRRTILEGLHADAE